MCALKKISPIVLVLLFIAVWTSCSDDSTAPPNEKPAPRQTCRRVPLPPPTNTVINVSDVTELVAAVGQANSTGNTTILLTDGTYMLYSLLHISADNVTIRSQSGDRDSVIVSGQGMEMGYFTTAVLVNGSGFVLADLTIGRTVENAVRLVGEVDNPLFHNVRFIDTGDQMLKVDPPPVDSARTDGGIVEWCSFEYTAGNGPDEYICGILAHKCRNWTVRNNVFKNIRSPHGAPAFHAVLFLGRSRGTLVDNNTIINCDRGIGFGLGVETNAHTGGLIRNNVVHTVWGVSIGLEYAVSTSVYNNTIYTENYDNSIEYRFAGTVNASIINNLTNAAITSRDGGTGVVGNNVVNAQASWFVNIAGGNGHLALADTSVVDRGQTLAAVTQDIDCETRPKGSAYDIGADER